MELRVCPQASSILSPGSLLEMENLSPQSYKNQNLYFNKILGERHWVRAWEKKQACAKEGGQAPVWGVKSPPNPAVRPR